MHHSIGQLLNALVTEQSGGILQTTNWNSINENCTFYLNFNRSDEYIRQLINICSDIYLKKC